MNKARFRLLVFLMSLSLIGIILVQLYWISTSMDKNEEEFKYHVQQVLGNVSNNLKDKELVSFFTAYNQIKDSIGKDPETSQLKEVYFYERDTKTNETIIYTNTLVAENYGITGSFFDNKADSVSIGNIVANRKTEVYNGNSISDANFQLSNQPNTTISKSGNLSSLDKANFEVVFKDL
jgi:two-component system phosphate regulon sensor histidine kinase PhoR